MSPEWMDTAIKAASFVLSIAAMGYALFANRRKYVDERFKEGSGRMDRHEARIARLEQTVSTMPGSGDIHGIQLNMERMTGAMQRLEAVMEGNAKIMARLETIVTRHEEHLLGERKQ